MSPTHHAISYTELTVDDLAAAKAFYTQAFDWRFTDYGPAYSGIVAADGDGEIGGLDGSGPPKPGGPLVLLYSTDLEASLAAVQQAGGTVVNGPYAYPGGRRFHFADPAGNELGVYSEE